MFSLFQSLGWLGHGTGGGGEGMRNNSAEILFLSFLLIYLLKRNSEEILIFTNSAGDNPGISTHLCSEVVFVLWGQWSVESLNGHLCPLVLATKHLRKSSLPDQLWKQNNQGITEDGEKKPGLLLWMYVLSLIHIWRCRRDVLCRSRWSPYH